MFVGPETQLWLPMALPWFELVPWENVFGQEDQGDTHGVLALDWAPGREGKGEDSPPGLYLTLPSP